MHRIKAEPEANSPLRKGDQFWQKQAKQAENGCTRAIIRKSIHCLYKIRIFGKKSK
jgi:hypothetical protein